jgi:peptidoglycan/xylan/chitin deacetylase (PgdA/CDA1 family)
MAYYGNFNPMVEKSGKNQHFIPEPYESVFLLSADFELAWAWRMLYKGEKGSVFMDQKATQARKNIPKILQLCERYSIPITWATVGHLFLEQCDGHDDIPRSDYYQNEYWSYDEGDWFDMDPRTNWKNALNWYAPDLIQQIRQSKVEHELGCHTFSHIDCREKYCPPETFRAELTASANAAREYQTEFRTFVHPAHTIGHLDILAEFGYSNFRSNYKNTLGFPKRCKNGLWELKNSYEIKNLNDRDPDFHIRRFIDIVKRSMKNRSVAVVWFHPSLESFIVDDVLPAFFQYLDNERDKIWICNHQQYIEWLNATEKDAI